MKKTYQILLGLVLIIIICCSLASNTREGFGEDGGGQDKRKEYQGEKHRGEKHRGEKRQHDREVFNGDDWILKSQIVPPVCPKCPEFPCKGNNGDTGKCPPCPPCGRCPEDNFKCVKEVDYSVVNQDELPVPFLNSFSQFK